MLGARLFHSRGPTAVEVGTSALALLLALLALWQLRLIHRLRAASPRVRFAKDSFKAGNAAAKNYTGRPATRAALKAHEAARVLDDLATVAWAKKEVAEMVEIDKAASLEKVLAAKTAALAKVEGRHRDVARYASIRTLEQAWCAEIATMEVARRLDAAALETAHASDRAVLEAVRRADSAAAALEAAQGAVQHERTRVAALEAAQADGAG
ncbi:hypothetical protein M885DRAFT_571989 [Pelagophyceae sp. CCMP2097]|nr:hypothetical protein M885DRAFT_571989 [Pelagophyceae sp. CCMP2097]